MALATGHNRRTARFRGGRNVVLRAGSRPVMVVERGGRPVYRCGRCDVALEREWRFCPECASSIGWVLRA